ncbi:MAG: pyridoxamine 5'-phosphate oxidase family protein [Puniceicoccales bacterium]|nr:pyridoxamine 5'-phosphate oxidase family protein [Puniceicoccales bacterium]
MSTETQIPDNSSAKPTIADARAAIAATRWAGLAIIREDGTPTIRPIGCFAPSSTGAQADVYFSTPRDSAKDKSLRKNPVVNFYFEPPVAEVAAYKGVSLIGKVAEVPADSPEYPAAVSALSAQSAFFKARAESGNLASTIIYRIHASELRYSDYALYHAIMEIPLSQPVLG